MSKRDKQWEANAEFGSDILGVGSVSMLPPSGKVKKELRIGFIKPKPKSGKTTKQNARR